MLPLQGNWTVEPDHTVDLDVRYVFMAFIILFYFFSAIHISFWFVCVAAVVEGFILFGFRGLKTIGNALDAPRCDAMRCESVCYRFNLIRLFRFVYLSILSEIEKHTYPNHTHTDTHTQACTRALPCLVACLVSRIAHTPRASKTMWGEPKWNHNICQAAERNAPHDIARGGSPTSPPACQPFPCVSICCTSYLVAYA